jgi:hypothetical protein
MKKSILLSVLCVSLLFSCKKNTEDHSTPNTPDNSAKWETGVVTSDMMQFLNTKAPTFNSYTVNSATTGIFSNEGIDVVIPPNVFVNANGSAYVGTVNIKMQTIIGTADMIYSGITTVAGNGELLISDGMFKLEAYDVSNNKLKLKKGSTIVVTFPAWHDDNKVFKGSDLTGKSNKIEWNEWDSMDLKRNNTVTLVVGLDSIFKYCNLDRFMDGTPLTDITVTTGSGFTNKNTECFLKYVGENASAYIPSKSSIKAFSTIGNGDYRVVQNKSAKIICFAKKDGKFYYQVKTITIGANQTLAMDNMVETTETNLEAIIAAF